MTIPLNRSTLAFGVCAALALAACGASTKTTVSAGAQPAASSATPTTKAASSAVAVMTSNISSFGAVLVDAHGMTLYTLTNGGKPVACTGQCATFWPPLLLAPGTMTAMGASGVTGLGTATAAGGLQVTANGAPLYRFSQDKAPGDAKGEGISSFGGTWRVSKAQATSAVTMPPVVTSPPATSPPATTPTTNLYGY